MNASIVKCLIISELSTESKLSRQCHDNYINKYKEVEREAIEYEPTEVILARIEELQNSISADIAEFKSKFANK